MAISGSLIRKLRSEAGLTQKRLAEAVGVTQAHIAKIEGGKVDPRLSTVNKIMRVLTEGKQKRSRDIMTRGVFFAGVNDRILKISDLMIRHGVSQVPVMVKQRVVGAITEETIIRNLRSNLAEEKAKNVMEKPLPIVQEETSIETVRSLLEKHQGVLVARSKEVVGIITRSDLLKTIE